MELFEGFRDHTTEVARSHILVDGEALPPYDAGFNSNISFDNESDSKPIPEFDL